MTTLFAFIRVQEIKDYEGLYAMASSVADRAFHIFFEFIQADVAIVHAVFAR